ncbi:hypothetical protein [Prevotella nigrescens]|uniref:hypothetical protein n=1 Tax=Prevotella nigrescens TaxID=28133 RepID=UPI0028E246FD|nr:hypothetical protein [Prevotella nigrescens]
MILLKLHINICNWSKIRLFLLFVLCNLTFGESYAQYYSFKTEEFYENRCPKTTGKKLYTSCADINGKCWKIKTDAEIREIGEYAVCLKVGTSSNGASYLTLTPTLDKSKIRKITIIADTGSNKSYNKLLRAEICFGDKNACFSAAYPNDSITSFSLENIGYTNIPEVKVFYDKSKKYTIAIHRIEITNEIIQNEDNSTTITSNKNVENNIIQVRRTLSKDYWNTFCLPFDVNEDSVKLHLNNPELREFTGNVNGTTMLFKDTTAIKAGVPYIIKPTKDVVNPIFRNVVITAVEPKEIADNTGTYAFVGAYSPTELKTDGTELFLGDKDYLYKPLKDDNKIKGMRAFFRIKDASQAKQSQYSISIDGTTTITLPNTKNIPSKTQEKIYTLDGRQVHSTHNLKSGIYIKNGKKIYIN